MGEGTQALSRWGEGRLAPARRVREVPHAIITGGGTGIGAAIARALSADGVALTLAGRRAEPIAVLAAELPDACAVSADVTDPASVRALFAAARHAHGPVDILVNNAGAAAASPFNKVSESDWRATMAVNLDALFHLTQAALDDLKASPAGRVVTVVSTAGLKGYAYTVAYSAAKHGAIGFTRALALELAGARVTVNAVCPGFTDTDLVARSVDQITAKTGRSVAEARAELARFNPQGRLIDPTEVASAVSWLCRPEQASVTGQAIVIAGGEVM